MARSFQAILKGLEAPVEGESYQESLQRGKRNSARLNEEDREVLFKGGLPIEYWGWFNYVGSGGYQ